MKMGKLNIIKRGLSYASRKCLRQLLTAYLWTFIFHLTQFYQYFKVEGVIGVSVHSAHTALFMDTDTENNVPNKWLTNLRI